MPKITLEKQLLPLLHSFILEMQRGKHLQKNGKKLKPNSIRNYKRLEIHLAGFCNSKQFYLRVKISKLSAREFNDEQKYWKNFYLQFTSYLYEELGHHDNYVGRTVKLLRSLFNYLIQEKGLNIGYFHRKFYAPSEEVDFQVLSTERLNLLIYDTVKESSLTADLKEIKDLFVFGCTVALRYSDLMNLDQTNIEVINQVIYLKVRSKKTDTFTRVKLAPYAVQILDKYKSCHRKRILPFIDPFAMNRKLKLLMEFYGFTEPISKTRMRRGQGEVKYRGPERKAQFRFCDAISTHTMRRTAITNMLSLGMNENMVRQISGHAANSKEFYRYVAFAQTIMDSQIDMVHQKMAVNS